MAKSSFVKSILVPDSSKRKSSRFKSLLKLKCLSTAQSVFLTFLVVLKLTFFFCCVCVCVGGGGGGGVCKYTQEEPKQMKDLFNCLGFYCTGYTTMGSFVGRGNRFIHLVKVLYCKLPTIGKQLPTFSHKIRGLNQRPQRWEGSVLPLCHHGPITNERRQATI